MKKKSILGALRAILLGGAILLAAHPALAAPTYHDFSTDPNISTAWTKYSYFGGTTSASWNSGTQALDLSKTNGNGGAGWYPTGATRSATTPVTLTVRNVSSTTVGAFGFVGLMITAVQQQNYTSGTGDSYTIALVQQQSGSLIFFRFEVRRTYADGTGNFQLYTGPNFTASGDYKFDIVRDGDHYKFLANGTLLYTTTGTGADFYTPAAKDAMIYYQAVMVSSYATTATIDNFGVSDTTPPLLATLSPADDATGVPAVSNLVATFNEAIAIGTGNITVRNLTDATESTIAITDGSQVSVAGAVLTVNPAADLLAGKDYAIRIDATAIKDPSGNFFAGISDDTTWNFAIATADTFPPLVSTLSPADNAIGVAAGSNLVVTFNEAIATSTGNITVKNLTDATESTIAITDGNQVAVAGSVLTINPTADLTPGKDYAIRVDATAIKDTAGNFFAGISDDSNWNFATDPPPLVFTLSPADDATNVTTGTNLVVTFSEPITVGTGNITVRNLTDATESTIDITDGSQVSVAGAVLTINPTVDLTPGKDYAIRIDGTAIKDNSGNSFAGIADDTAWNFATDGTPPTVATLNPYDDATAVVTSGNLVVTFNEPIAIGIGNITIRNLTDGPAYDVTIDITDGSQVSVVGSVLTINPAADLTVGKDYAIRIDATAVKDSSGNLFAGIADDTTWNFATDATPPTVVTLSPADDATDGSPFGNLVVTFNEAITIGTGNITIKNLTDATESPIDITDGSQVSVSGSVLTINPTADLTAGEHYAIRIDATAIKDSSGNFFAGIADDTTWNFATWPIMLFDEFSTDPGLATRWTSYRYWNSVPPADAATWNGTNQDMTLQKTTSGVGGWLLGLCRTGATRAATDPVTMTVKSLSPRSGGTWGFVGLMITSVRQQDYLLGGGDSYTIALAYPNNANQTRIEVRRTYADGSGTFSLYAGPSFTFSAPIRLDIVRNGDHYEFKADSTTVYTTALPSAGDFYDTASKDSMIYYQVVFGGDSAMTAAVDDFGIPSGVPTSGYASWQAANGATGQTLADDHDGDGVPNGVEFFLGGPTGNTTGFTALSGIVKDPGTGALSVTWPKGSGYAGTYGTDFVVETSETLTEPWTPETLAPSGQVTDTASTVTYTFPSPLGSKKFARLKVTGP